MIRESSRPISPIPTGLSPRSVPLPSVQWIVFDVYGTLLTSGAGEIGTAAPREASSVDACDRIARRWGVRGISGTDLAAALVERIRVEHRIHTSQTVPHPEIDIREIWQRVIDPVIAAASGGPAETEAPPAPIDPEEIALEHELAVNPVWPMPGAIETIATLHQRGYHLGIVSNAQFYTPLTIEALFGGTVEELGFSRCVWSYETRAAKPSPPIFRRFLSPDDGNPIDPPTALYVGNDMRNDVCAAAAEGFRTALFAGDERSLRLRQDDPSLCTLEPDVTITDLRQLLEVLAPQENRPEPVGQRKGSNR